MSGESGWYHEEQHLVPFAGRGVFVFSPSIWRSLRRGGGILINRIVARMGRLLVTLLALLLAVGCSSPKPAQLMGPEAKLLAQRRVQGAVVMLGLLPSGEWMTAVVRGKEQVASQTVTPRTDRPMPFIGEGVCVVAGKAPPGAERYELMTETREIIKGKVEDGVYLIAWPTRAESPAFILRILDAEGNELYRWPPPGALPAA